VPHNPKQIIGKAARQTARIFKQIMPKKTRLSEAEQLRNFTKDQEAGFPMVNGWLKDGKLNTVKDYLGAMQKIKKQHKG
jgi:hypothetical protein